MKKNLSRDNNHTQGFTIDSSGSKIVIVFLRFMRKAMSDVTALWFFSNLPNKNL